MYVEKKEIIQINKLVWLLTKMRLNVEKNKPSNVEWNNSSNEKTWG